MPTWKTIAFTTLELKGLWLKATGATITDETLDQAGENAIDKVYRAEKGMPRKANPEPPGGKKAGPPLDLRRPA